MSELTNQQQDLLKQLSRRNLLRNAAITATGAFLLPSFLTGCTKDVRDIIHGHGGHGWVGDSELTSDQLAAAANNIDLMRKLLANLYQNTFDYDSTVLEALESTVENGDWTNFLINIFIDIGIAMLGAVPFLEEAMPALALAGSIIKDWGLGNDRPSNLKDFFAAYQAGQLAMKGAIDKKLATLINIGDNYANLRAQWNDPIVFNGATYTLSNLASTKFPDENINGVAYYKIYDAMYDHHKRSVWNLAVMKCCTLYRHYHYIYDLGETAVEYARNEFYSDPKYAGSYLRGHLNGVGDYIFYYWDLGINGNPFPPAAIKALFKDDTPGHIINPDGLFNRSYVFEQFNITKPDFTYYAHELSNDLNADFNTSADDWHFTGGLFPELTK